MTRLGACVMFSLIASSAYAEASKPLYDITVVNNVSSDFKYGPFAKSLSEGTSPAYASGYVKNNAFSFFDVGPHEFDFGQHMRRMFDCYDRLDSSVCDAFWMNRGDNMAYDWHYDTVVYQKQAKSVVNDGTPTDEDDFILTKVDEDGNGVGYRVNPETTNYVRYHEVSGVARFNNKTFILKSPVSYIYKDNDNENIGGYASALTFTKLEDGRILVGGYGSFDENRNDSWFYHCFYYGNVDTYGDYKICPAFKTQATLWIIDPANDADGAEIIGQQPTNYLADDSDDSDMAQAAIRGFTTVNNKLYALGYSPTDDYYGDAYFAASVAVYWPITISGNTVTFGQNKEFENVEMPGNHDETNSYTWVAGGNNNGKVIINRKMAKSTNSNYAIMFGVSAITETANPEDSGNPIVATESTIYPLEDNPIRGANSVAEAINDNGFVVGWRDDRNDISPVNGGISRDYEGFFYDSVSKRAFYMNDMICHKLEDGSTDCAQNQKYYYIAWPVAINNENIILATAYEYPTYDDWINIKNAKLVTVMLKPNDTTFVTSGTGTVINQSGIVAYDRPEPNYAEEGNGGGSVGLLSIFGLAFGAGFLGMRRRKQK